MTDELPDDAQRLLEALVEIESKAVWVAREHGCECNQPISEDPAHIYPYAVFDHEKSVGKPFNQIAWEMHHEDGCPMQGQKGVGLTTYGDYQ